MELLKDRPEFKETIENNIFFKNDIAEIMSNVEAEVSFKDDKDEMTTEFVEAIIKHSDNIEIGGEKVGECIVDKQALAIDLFEIVDTYSGNIEVETAKITEQLIEKIAAFVKENYGLSIKEAYLQSTGIL